MSFKRESQYPVAPWFLDRWSPRAFKPVQLTDEQLMTIFEAARWAPSSYNNQPWRFIYAHRQTSSWEKLFGLLVDFNKQWAQHASVLVVMVSKDSFDFNGKPSRTHSFDAGAAWMSLALQASAMDLYAHGMEGFNYERAKKELGVPEGYTVEAMCAIGYLGDVASLPADMQQREEPSDRKPLTALVAEGSFKE